MSIAILIIGVAIVFLLFFNIRIQQIQARNQVKLAKLLTQIRDKKK
jgi:hypothetical protein